MILDGKVEKAKKIDGALMPLFKIVGVTTVEDVKLPGGKTAQVTYKFPNPVPIKTMMVGLGMIKGPCKRPLGRLTKKGVTVVRNALKQVWAKDPYMLEPIEDYYDIRIEKRLEDDKAWKKLSY
jgi:4-hydroxy-tetrahydrodipicolinate synthase